MTHCDPPNIPIEVRLNLNDLLKERFGSGFAKDPRMLNLMLLNGERDKRFLEGPQEAEAFQNKEFIRMNSSTISKVEFFRHVIILVQNGRLCTAGTGLFVQVDRILESRWSRMIALMAAAAGVLQLIFWMAGVQH